ncbi:MAG: hypothetical protein M1814_001480 [Vezdaea aestivalis]|nr:MAG: hypothetical protein M1814_001480 [Vezdaea aestivalis]
MVRLGLDRIARLVDLPLVQWRAIHVAGTNGKGSICTYASALLQATSIRHGSFTSPHLIDRWDCIRLHGKTISEVSFHVIEKRVRQLAVERKVDASPFELLTATAFHAFSESAVELAVVEVGMGGRQDATNVLRDPLVTVISKIGLDHQAFLGNTLEEIAKEKAGIMKGGVPCIIDGTNAIEVMAVLEKVSKEIGVASLQVVDYNSAALPETARRLPNHQRANLACAITAVQTALERHGVKTELNKHIQALPNISVPGRLQEFSIENLTGRLEPVLLDGAHNRQSARVLADRVASLRNARCPITWLVAATKGKDLSDLFSPLIQPGDQVVTTRFGSVDGMLWIEAASRQELSKALPNFEVEHVDDVGDALELASTKAAGRPLVVAGSLYLVGEVHRLLRERSSIYHLS